MREARTEKEVGSSNFSRSITGFRAFYYLRRAQNYNFVVNNVTTVTNVGLILVKILVELYVGIAIYHCPRTASAVCFILNVVVRFPPPAKRLYRGVAESRMLLDL